MEGGVVDALIVEWDKRKTDFIRNKPKDESEKERTRTHNVWYKEVKRGGIV